MVVFLVMPQTPLFGHCSLAVEVYFRPPPVNRYGRMNRLFPSLLPLRPLLLFAVICGVSSNVIADWTDSSMAFKCAPRSGEFAVRGVVATSSPDAGTVPVPPGFSEVTEGRTIRCKLPGVAIETVFKVYPPHSRGYCGALTLNEIVLLRVNGRLALPPNRKFNLLCDDEILYMLDVQHRSGITLLRMCFASWDWGTGYAQTRCEEQPL